MRKTTKGRPIVHLAFTKTTAVIVKQRDGHGKVFEIKKPRWIPNSGNTKHGTHELGAEPSALEQAEAYKLNLALQTPPVSSTILFRTERSSRPFIIPSLIKR